MRHDNTPCLAATCRGAFGGSRCQESGVREEKKEEKSRDNPPTNPLPEMEGE